MPMPSNNLQLPEKHFKKLLFLIRAIAPKATVWAFGSRVNGSPQELSDIDLVAINPTNPSESIEAFSRLQAAFQESNLPYLVDLHDWANLPDSFKQNIEKSHVVLQSILAK